MPERPLDPPDTSAYDEWREAKEDELAEEYREDHHDDVILMIQESKSFHDDYLDQKWEEHLQEIAYRKVSGE